MSVRNGTEFQYHTIVFLSIFLKLLRAICRESDCYGLGVRLWVLDRSGHISSYFDSVLALIKLEHL